MARLVRFCLLAATICAIALGFAGQPGLAKGSFDRLVVYGQSLALEISEPSLLSFDAFNDFSTPIRGTPTVSGEGYLVVRYGLDQGTSEYVAFDSLRLFPGEPGYVKASVYYEGLVNGSSEYDGKWYEARPEAESTVRSLVEAKTPSASVPLASAMSLTLACGAGASAGALVPFLLIRSRRAAADRVRADRDRTRNGDQNSL